MKIAVLNSSFDLSGFLYDYIAFEYGESYNEASTFSLEVAFSKQNMELLAPEGYVVFDNTLFVIQERILDENKIIAKGESFLGLFKNVILEKPTLYSDNPYTNLMKMMKLAQFKAITFEVFTSDWSGGEYNDMFPYDCTVYSQLEKISSLYGFGFKVYFVTSQRIVRIMMTSKYDKSLESGTKGVLISDRQNDYLKCEYENDVSNYKNYAHVPYGFDANGKYVYVNVDWRKNNEIMRGMTVNIEKVLSSSDLETALKYQGELALASHRRRYLYKVELARDVDLIPGEICTFESKKYNERCRALLREKIIKERNGVRQVILMLEKEL